MNIFLKIYLSFPLKCFLYYFWLYDFLFCFLFYGFCLCEFFIFMLLSSFVYLDYLYALSLLMLFNTSVVKSIIAVNIKIYTGNNPMLIYCAISPNNGGINVVPT